MTPRWPHSSVSTVERSHGFSEQGVPFSRLNAAITIHGAEFATQISKGRRYSSRRVRSSTIEFGRIACPFVFVRHEVLQAGADALALEPVDERRAEPTAQERILGVVLEVPAAERRPLEVEARREDHLDAECVRLFRDRPADLADEVRRPSSHRALKRTGSTSRAR